MKKDRSRERSRYGQEREVQVKKVDANKALGKKWRRFLETEDLDDFE